MKGKKLNTLVINEKDLRHNINVITKQDMSKRDRMIFIYQNLE